MIMKLTLKEPNQDNYGNNDYYDKRHRKKT